ncbi:hypothetical protein [Streptosporangium sp. KLBMP 9127]|nr:hypothetical protein [Streptosporangium sp. KLBMP 9127]
MSKINGLHKVSLAASAAAVLTMALVTGAPSSMAASISMQAPTAITATDDPQLLWSCGWYRVTPTDRKANASCTMGAGDNRSRGVWDCDWQTDIWMDWQHSSWSKSNTCDTYLNHVTTIQE